MEPKTETSHDEKPVGTVPTEPAPVAGEAKQAQVLSVGLHNALVQDQISPWSWTQVRMYAIMALTTLSK